jgi:hypothetical protein
MLTITNAQHAPGRPKGFRPSRTPSISVQRDLREMILGALEDAGGRRYLAQRAIDTPGPFLALLGKILPTKVEGDAGSSITLHLLAAQLVSEQLLQTQQSPPTLNADPERAPQDLLNAPLPTE